MSKAQTDELERVRVGDTWQDMEVWLVADREVDGLPPILEVILLKKTEKRTDTKTPAKREFYQISWHVKGGDGQRFFGEYYRTRIDGREGSNHPSMEDVLRRRLQLRLSEEYPPALTVV